MDRDVFLYSFGYILIAVFAVPLLLNQWWERRKERKQAARELSTDPV